MTYSLRPEQRWVLTRNRLDTPAMPRKTQKKKAMLTSDFGKRLRALRDERGLSQRELADRLGTRPPQLSRYENGSQLPTLETLVAIAEVLRVPPAMLLGGSDGIGLDDGAIKDVRLLERVRELEKLDRQARETAIAVLEAIIVQGSQRALGQRLTGTPSR